jgi:hypothetical protein
MPTPFAALIVAELIAIRRHSEMKLPHSGNRISEQTE